ncbi:hypothetical protein PQO03_06655 [Lentisphaera profundi]|uniref:Histidine kinase N-terminal 7TM region domain-containing protein n=1 Tax=Lentisphaera profundi TaxID=1658616 RepID=A0ABY7VRB2_9BACT|nr:hypothetical protein [Lentisphaera profundi]WDE95396.1 hypothetical protein PQO03_06655 [Lentisphaera profundi]
MTWVILSELQFRWIFKVGDPDIWSWLITLAYFLCFYINLKALAKIKNSFPKKSALLYQLSTGMLFFLGLNKQLDFQILLNDIGSNFIRLFELRQFKTQMVLIVMVLWIMMFIVIVKKMISKKDRWVYFNRYLFIGFVLSLSFMILKIISIYHLVPERFYFIDIPYFLKTLESFSIILIFVGFIKSMKDDGSGLRKAE